MSSNKDGPPPSKQQKLSSLPLFSETSDWNPDHLTGPLPPTCLSRVTRELIDLQTNPVPGVWVVQDEDDMGKVHALLSGPTGTPYQGGYFYLILRVTDQYPMRPPKARLVTTGSGQVQFNPKLYKNGKVCLSILGLVVGPCWTPAMGLISVLLSVQSLLNDRPYCNEPGCEAYNAKNCSAYNVIIQHETVRAAVCDMMERRVHLPESLFQEMRRAFTQHYNYYVDLCKRNLKKDGQQMWDPLLFYQSRPKYNYGDLLKRLDVIKRLDAIDNQIGEVV